MQFYSPYFLNLLWLTPVLAFCFIASSWLQTKRVGSFLKTKEVQGKLLPHYNRGEWPTRAICLLAAFVFSVLALSQPQWGEEKRRVERKGVDLIFLLDVSTSMLAEDIKPSRVQKAKFEIESFVKSLKGHRIGMLTFAGSSFMQTPLTLDYSAFLIFLGGVDVGHVPDPGTLLGPAINKAIDSFPDDKSKHRALIIFSDGEDHEPDIESAVENAKKKSVRIYTIGTATADGAPIPLKSEAGVQSGVKKDRDGKIVITKLNKEILSKIAAETGGIYLPATPAEKEIEFILKHLETLGEKKLEDRLITEKEDHFQIFLFLALFSLFLEMVIRRAFANKLAMIPVLFFIFLTHSAFIQTPQAKVEEGNTDFEGKKYQSAITKYREVQVKNPDSPPVNYNLATSLYKVDQFQESAANLKKAVDQSTEDPEFQAKAAYNYGNALYRVGDYEGAIAAYKKALELNPADEDAKYNLEFIQNQKDKFEKENQDRKKNNPDKKKDKNQEQNQKDKQNQGGGSNQDKNQGKSDQQNQQGSSGQNESQNQGGKGENQQNSGQNQNEDKKDEGEGQNQQDQSEGSQSDKNKEQNKDSAGEDQKDNQENQSSDSQNQGNEHGQSDKSDSANKNQKPDQGQGQNQQNQEQDPSEKQDPAQQGQGGQGDGSEEGQKDQPEEKGEQPSSQGTQGEGQKPGQNGAPNPASQGSGSGQPLQGQMTKENAEYLLASLEDGEKKFQIMRKPPENRSETPYVEKDW